MGAKANANAIIAIGGGSVIDTAKTAANFNVSPWQKGS